MLNGWTKDLLRQKDVGTSARSYRKDRMQETEDDERKELQIQ